MNLIIDFGNTLAKFYLFDNKRVVGSYKLKYIDFFFTENSSDFKFRYIATNNVFLEKFLIEKNVLFNNVIISSVVEYPKDFVLFFRNLIPKGKLIELSNNTSVPIINLYKNKAKLGKDRLAAAIGAYELYPKKNILVIDAGSAITYEFVSNKNEYLGGNISPGLQMRMKALNVFTNKLPLIEILEGNNFSLSNKNLIGKDTETAIINGVFQGLLMEIEGYINKMKSMHNNFITLLTGGDAFFFEKELKSPIFAQPNLVAIGLNAILKYNLNGL